MRIGRRKRLAALVSLGVVLLAGGAHVRWGVTGVLAVVLLLQIGVVAAIAQLRVDVLRALRSREPRADSDRLLGEIERLHQRHAEAVLQSVHEAVARLEAAISDEVMFLRETAADVRDDDAGTERDS